MAQQSSRLQRLLTLLDTGSSRATRLTATRQIGDIVKSHPLDLNSLLKKEYDIGSDNENNPKERLALQKQNLRCHLGKITSISRAGYDQRARNQHLQLPFEQWSSSKLSQGPMIQNHCYLSTMTTNDTSEEGSEQKTISVTFVDKDGEEKNIEVPIGMSMLEAAHENDIELEGACEGSLACSTCHVIVMDVDYYNKLEDPTDEENDMLDLAFGLTETSRLGCQVIAKPELDGIRLAIPAATRNFAVDGYVPKPH